MRANWIVVVLVLLGWACVSEQQEHQAEAVCGNGVVETGEECDDGPGDCVIGEPGNCDIFGDHCRKDCTLPYCGDGLVDLSLGESCDFGPWPSGAPRAGCAEFCDASCTYQGPMYEECCRPGQREGERLCEIVYFELAEWLHACATSADCWRPDEYCRDDLDLYESGSCRPNRCRVPGASCAVGEMAGDTEVGYCLPVRLEHPSRDTGSRDGEFTCVRTGELGLGAACKPHFVEGPATSCAAGFQCIADAAGLAGSACSTDADCTAAGVSAYCVPDTRTCAPMGTCQQL